ncbi:MAG TPA: histidinol dehydrogenase, partial [Thermoanaerobaculia bacterium]|nr:histidinol dehydrogenase [Thermoanaerobaculia bacterium]
AGSEDGKRFLAELSTGRSRPDFAALKDALPIVEGVLHDGEKALRHFVRELDGAPASEPLVVRPSELPKATVDPEFAQAFRLAYHRVEAYHHRQRAKGFAFVDRAGVSFEERPVPYEAVGIYVPGGRAFYPSSLLMGVAPARAAKVPRIVVATPPRAFRESAALRWALAELGVDEVLLAGGAHAIAGLVAVSRCVKIVGPGNRWVAAAKHLVSTLVAVDLPAGPSEVLIVAEKGVDAGSVAADLLAQAEHDPDAVPLLFTDSRSLAEAVKAAVVEQLADLPTAETARASLERHGAAVVFENLEAAAKAATQIAAEHVQLFGRGAEKLAARLAATSGAVFVGESTPTPFGDYLAGPNHVLPTGGAARSFSGLSTRDFVRFTRVVRFSKKAAAKLAPFAATIARAEELEGHARSVERRLR